MSEEKNFFGGAIGILKLFLAFFLIVVTFFVIYINEISTDFYKLREFQTKKTFVSEIFLGDYSSQVSAYKKDFLKELHNGHQITTWVFRSIGMFLLWFALTLIFLSIESHHSKHVRTVFALGLSFLIIGIGIIFIHLYIFVTRTKFGFDIGVLKNIYVVYLIIFIFLLLLYSIYNYGKRQGKQEIKPQKEEEVSSFKLYKK